MAGSMAPDSGRPSEAETAPSSARLLERESAAPLELVLEPRSGPPWARAVAGLSDALRSAGQSRLSAERKESARAKAQRSERALAQTSVPAEA